MSYSIQYTQEYNITPFPFHSQNHQPMHEEKPSMCNDKPANGAFWGSSPAVAQSAWFPSNPTPPPPCSYHIPSNPRRVNSYRSAPAPLTEDQVRQIFMKFDLNGDNVLSREEIRQAFNYLGAMFPAQQARQGIKLADSNGDGVVDMSEMEDLVKYAYNLGYVVR
ncbi:calmodulin-like protein 5 [Manihot esculenta]|uniref:EF-hand domain-containing protein n=1 Tax=Manihot esculenta TaxID=3983 RepID=A0A2C9W3H0_MANES|nr:calmodulin-like protein 5 [Manihot esculenta]OAY52688.1 hypothetical protein MANES_04G103000v8 [Manihot esculenta]